MRSILVALAMLWAPLLGAQTNFVNETIQDLEIAIDNYPERVKVGPEVTTVLGNQITPGTLPQEFLRNQQIYDDIAITAGHIINLMRMIMNLPSQPTTLPNMQLAMDVLLQHLTDLGIRYNISSNLSSIRTELQEMMADIRQAPYSRHLIVYYARLETIKGIIDNLLKTKLVGSNP